MTSPTVARILQGHAPAVLASLPTASVHCIVTSPPYYAVRDYGTPPVKWPDGWIGQLGLEPTPYQYVSHLADVFDALKRVLHPSGTLWLNLGDSYAGGGTGKQGKSGQRADRSFTAEGLGAKPIAGLKPKDLIGIPWRVAFELQSRGWYLRDAITWAKANPMPSSVSDRCTSSYEMFFQLSLRPTYYFDAYAIREPISETSKARYKYGFGGGKASRVKETDNPTYLVGDRQSDGFRNKRNVWTLPTEPSRIKHYAMMPTRLIEPAILAGSSEHGVCADCFEPYRRVLSKSRAPTRPGTTTKIEGATSDEYGNRDPQRHITTTTHLGWEPGCNCGCPDILPSVIIDPFAGAGTVGLVARRLGRSFIGIELKPDYVRIGESRITAPASSPHLARNERHKSRVKRRDL